MENPWIRYSLLRLGLFFGLFLFLRLLSFDWLFAALIAALVSFALSLLILDRERDRLSEVIHNRFSRSKSGSYRDEESDLENEILDSASKRRKAKPKADEKGKGKGSKGS